MPSTPAGPASGHDSRRRRGDGGRMRFAPPNTDSPAAKLWEQALKLRKALQRRLEKIGAEAAPGTDITQFEACDGLLEKLRLSCVQAIFLDFHYAVANGVEEALWDSHVAINAEYRRILRRPKAASHAVERRKAEKMYKIFLRIAQKFYVGYVQRLGARYDIPELRRAAQGINAEPLHSGDRISHLSSDLSTLVLESCHSTLLHLGDLARYRQQANQKRSDYEAALNSYNLARQIMPQSGFALHQIGIVHLDCGNHLDIVYNFYRSRVAHAPHPNAKANLENEFKTLRRPKSDKGRSASQDAFSSWFVKLHALFYQGEPFSQQAALEQEAMHWLERACRDASSSNTLLKMALINMSAYELARANHAVSKTESALRFSRFSMVFNVRFLRTFCGVLESELREAVSNRDHGASEPGDVELTPTITSMLPVLRVYCVWIVSQRHELFAPDPTDGVAVEEMTQKLASVFTLLCATSCNRQGLATCPYLLPEDLETRGFAPLAGDRVPMGCSVYTVDGSSEKSYISDPEKRRDDSYEQLARILDILRCAYFMAEDLAVPLSYRAVEDALLFEHRSLSEPPGPADAPEASSSDAPPAQADAPVAQNPERRPAMTPAGAADDERIEEWADDHAARTVLAMCSPFLKPPTPQPNLYARSPSDSSSLYDMHHPGANENWGSSSARALPRAAGLMGPITPYPWAWNDMPKPGGAQSTAASAGEEAFHRASRRNSPRDTADAGFPADGPLAAPGHASPSPSPRLPLDHLGRADGPRGAADSAAERAHRERLLQSLAGHDAYRLGPTTGSPMAPQPAPSWGPAALGLAAAAHVSAGSSLVSHPGSVYHGAYADGPGQAQPRGLWRDPGVLAMPRYDKAAARATSWAT